MRMKTLAPLGLLAVAAPVLAQSNISAVNKHSWSENCGWMNWRDAQGGHAGVRVLQDHLAGFVWAENLGWISLGSGQGPYANTNGSNFGVNLAPGGQLSGFAWSENAGWINFSGGALATPAQPARYDAPARRFRGYAWGENIGWINLDLAEPGTFVGLGCPADWNQDGQVDASDITAFLSAWFADRQGGAGSLLADFNGSGATDASDITAFLNAWFADRASGEC